MGEDPSSPLAPGSIAALHHIPSHHIIRHFSASARSSVARDPRIPPLHGLCGGAAAPPATVRRDPSPRAAIVGPMVSRPRPDFSLSSGVASDQHPLCPRRSCFSAALPNYCLPKPAPSPPSALCIFSPDPKIKPLACIPARAAARYARPPARLQATIREPQRGSTPPRATTRARPRSTPSACRLQTAGIVWRSQVKKALLTQPQARSQAPNTPLCLALLVSTQVNHAVAVPRLCSRRRRRGYLRRQAQALLGTVRPTYELRGPELKMAAATSMAAYL
ncbi:hypothetical protein JHW43_001230 [Diplocarpon mali]|nr:hypothetical protein JHW43_001230 [Diplocarpon mali]